MPTVFCLGSAPLPNPSAPVDDSHVGIRVVLKHCQELQQVPIRIMEVERASRHPGQYYGLFCSIAFKIQWSDARLAQDLWRLQQLLQTHPKGQMQTLSQRHSSDLPQAQH